MTPVSTSTDAVMAAQVLVSKGVQAFFAMAGQYVFASFEALKKVCDQARLPVFSSESGLVARGAVPPMARISTPGGGRLGRRPHAFSKR